MTAKPNAMPDGALTADDRAAIVQRHFTVTREDQLIDGVLFLRSLRAWPALRAAFARTKGSEPTPAPAVPVEPAPVVPVSAPSVGLREQLGLR